MLNFIDLAIYRLLVNFRNKIIFYGEELLAPRPTPKLEDHLLSAVHDCLFNIFAATLHIWRLFPPYLEAVPSIRNLRMRHAVVTRDPPNMGRPCSMNGGHEECL
jgi:hypothetical protein